MTRHGKSALEASLLCWRAAGHPAVNAAEGSHVTSQVSWRGFFCLGVAVGPRRAAAEGVVEEKSRKRIEWNQRGKIRPPQHQPQVDVRRSSPQEFRCHLPALRAL